MHANMHLKWSKYALKTTKYALKNFKTSTTSNKTVIKMQKSEKAFSNKNFFIKKSKIKQNVMFLLLYFFNSRSMTLFLGREID